MEDESYAARAWGYRSPEVKLEPSKYGYLVLCVNYDKGMEGNFKLQINSNEQIGSYLKPFEEAYYLKETKKVEGSWTSDECGGCAQESSFHKNPQYLLRVRDPTRCLLELESEDAHPVGMVLFELD